jgi:hypothetical protein
MNTGALQSVDRMIFADSRPNTPHALHQGGKMPGRFGRKSAVRVGGFSDFRIKRCRPNEGLRRNRPCIKRVTAEPIAFD